jgi:NADPH:quinone reductase-like Zn-dependent oxidoreductase
VQTANVAGTRVIAMGVTERKLEVARKYGAYKTICARQGEVVEEVRSLTKGKKVDAFIDFVGGPDSV